MSEEVDRQIHYAVRQLEEAFMIFEKRTRIPLRGYTVRQPYAKSIRAAMLRIGSKLTEEFREIQLCLEPDPEETK